MNDNEKKVPRYAEMSFYEQSDEAIIAYFASCDEATRKNITSFIGEGNRTQYGSSEFTYFLGEPQINCSVFAALALADAVDVFEYLFLSPDGWGLDIRDVPREHYNLLTRAIKNFSNRVANWLMKQGLELYTAPFLIRTCDLCDCFEYTDVLGTAIECGNTEMAVQVVNQFTVRQLCDCNRYGTRPNKASAALMAVKCNMLPLVKAMANIGVDFYTVKDVKGETAVSWAAFNGYNEMLAYFIQRYNIDVDAQQGSKNRTLLQEAYQGGHVSTFAMLMEAGADPAILLSGQNNRSYSVLYDILFSNQWNEFLPIALAISPDLVNIRIDDMCQSRLMCHTTIGTKIAMKQKDAVNANFFLAIEDAKRNTLPYVRKLLAMESI